MNKKIFRLAHLSDLHFAHASWCPGQFFSKRWLGNLNLILFRNKTMRTAPLLQLPLLLKKLQVEQVLITGDVATTSLHQEFAQAKAFVNQLEELDLPVHLIPGNHDVYTKGSDKTKRFYHYFPGAGKQSRVEARSLKPGWWWIGLDTALATPLWLSSGTFFTSMKSTLEKTLSTIPKEDKVILANHFPLFGTHHPRHDLKGRFDLQKIIQDHPSIVLYLHGHDHTPYIIDRTDEGYPLVSNSGSCADAKKRTFSYLELSETTCHIQSYIFDTTWKPDTQNIYSLKRGPNS